MDEETQELVAKLRLTAKQIRSLAKAMENTKAEEVELSRGADGRLIARAVVVTEKLRALPLK